VRSNLRYAIDMIRRGGGDNVAVRQGGRHTRVEFVTPDGKRGSLTLHRGSHQSSRYADSVRSQLRREGLTL